MEQEIWKDVIGYEGLYQISSYGKLKRLSGYSLSVREGYKDSKIYHEEKILKSQINHKGYYQNELRLHNGKKIIRKKILIHRLVAEAFIGKCPIDKTQVNHINCIKTDNCYKNLEWCNNSENQIHARINNLLPKAKKGFENFQSKSVVMLNTDGEVIKIFGSLSEVEREMLISRQNITKVLKGKRNTAGGYKWKYLN